MIPNSVNVNRENAQVHNTTTLLKSSILDVKNASIYSNPSTINSPVIFSNKTTMNVI